MDDDEKPIPKPKKKRRNFEIRFEDYWDYINPNQIECLPLIILYVTRMWAMEAAGYVAISPKPVKRDPTNAIFL